MICITINRNDSKHPIYRQIYHEMKEAIYNKKFEINEKLPSKRMLAKELGVSINSVSNAYEQLLAEGYIYSIEKSGYYVEAMEHFVPAEPDVVKADLLEDLKEQEVDREGWLSLSHMTADISMFPFKEWIKSEKTAIKFHEQELSEISHPQGPYLVRKTIARLIALSRGVVCEPEQIVIGPGTQPLVRQLMDMMPRSTTTSIENPGYFRFYQQLIDMDFQVVPISVDKKGIDIQDVEKVNPDYLFITPSHQFPTGVIMPISRRIELLNWAVNQEKYIVEDDYDSEFKYETDNIPSLQSLDQNHRVIYTGTFSKTLMPSLRISYMVLPPKLLKMYRQHYSNWIQGTNSLSLFTLHYFIETGEYSKHIRRMNNYYETKRKRLIKEIKQRFKNDVQIKDIQAGLHFLAEFSTDQTYEETIARAKEKKLEIYPLTRFMLSELFEREKKIGLIIGFASISMEDISEAVERLCWVFKLG